MRAIDVAVLQFLNEFLGRSPTFDRLMQELSFNDLAKGALPVAALWWFWMQPHAQQQRRRELVISATAGALIAATLSRVLSVWLQRPRPLYTRGLDLASPFPAAPMSYDSFPSDHAALAFGLVTGIALISPAAGIALALYAVVFVCFPRVYLGVHWPFDLVAGGCIGALVTAALSTARPRSALARPAMSLLRRSPGAFYACMFLLAFGLMTRFEDVRHLGRWAVDAATHAHAAPERSSPRETSQLHPDLR